MIVIIVASDTLQSDQLQQIWLLSYIAIFLILFYLNALCLYCFRTYYS